MVLNQNKEGYGETCCFLEILEAKSWFKVWNCFSLIIQKLFTVKNLVVSFSSVKATDLDALCQLFFLKNLNRFFKKKKTWRCNFVKDYYSMNSENPEFKPYYNVIYGALRINWNISEYWTCHAALQQRGIHSWLVILKRKWSKHTT